MDRINIIERDEYDGTPRLAGWFDAEKAEPWNEATRWNGSNHISVPTGSQWDHERLYRTAGGRYVVSRWSQWQGAQDSYEYIDDEAAREWLLLNGHDDDIERLFGEPPEPERGPVGRPAIGPLVNITMPQSMIDALDEIAERDNVSRAEVVRRAVAGMLGAE